MCQLTKSDAKRLHRESGQTWNNFVVDLFLADWITLDQLLTWN